MEAQDIDDGPLFVEKTNEKCEEEVKTIEKDEIDKLYSSEQIEEITSNNYYPDFAYLKKLIGEDVKDTSLGWYSAVTDKFHSVFAKTDPINPVVLVKVFAKFTQINLSQLFTLIINCEERKKWDKIIKDLYITEKLDDYSDIIYCVIKTPPGFSDRDYVQYRYYLNNKKNADLIEKYNLPICENEYYILYLKSVIKEDIPHVKNLVRAETIITGYMIEQDGEDIKFTMVLQTDVKGNIPKSIFNRVSTRVPGMWLKNLIDGYNEKHKESAVPEKKE